MTNDYDDPDARPMIDEEVSMSEQPLSQEAEVDHEYEPGESGSLKHSSKGNETSSGVLYEPEDPDY